MVILAGGTIMNTRRIFFAFMTTLFIMFLSGCAATVGTPPPPHHVEVRPLVVPSAGAVWIDGHYIYRHGDYVWEPADMSDHPIRGQPGRRDTGKSIVGAGAGIRDIGAEKTGTVNIDVGRMIDSDMVLRIDKKRPRM